MRPEIIITGKNFTDLIRARVNGVISSTIEKSRGLINQKINPALQAEGLKTTPATIFVISAANNVGKKINITSIARGEAVLAGKAIVHKHFVAFVSEGE
jgi:hypothetical protein